MCDTWVMKSDNFAYSVAKNVSMLQYATSLSWGNGLSQTQEGCLALKADLESLEKLQYLQHIYRMVLVRICFSYCRRHCLIRYVKGKEPRATLNSTFFFINFPIQENVTAFHLSSIVSFFLWNSLFLSSPGSLYVSLTSLDFGICLLQPP